MLKSYNQLKKSLEKQRKLNAQQVGIQELNAHKAGIGKHLAQHARVELKSYNQLKKSLEKQRNSNAQQVGIQELNTHNAGICQRLAKYGLTSLLQVLSHNFLQSLFLVPLDAIFV